MRKVSLEGMGWNQELKSLKNKKEFSVNRKA